MLPYNFEDINLNFIVDTDEETIVDCTFEEERPFQVDLGVFAGTGSEPDQYLKSASVNGNTLTLVKKDDSTVIYSPQVGASNWQSITNKPFESIDTQTLKVENSVLKVNTTVDALQDNTQPITSGGVHTLVGNINALLETI